MSALLRLAIEDAQKAEKTPGYELDMMYWHNTYKKRKTCVVCMAGAVMAMSLEVDPHEHIDLDYLVSDMEAGRTDEEACTVIELNIDQLYAINEMRMGDFYNAIWELRNTSCGESSEDELDIFREAALELNENDYKAGRYPWEQYLAAANVLEKYGY